MTPAPFCSRRHLLWVFAMAVFAAAPVSAADEAPDAFVRRFTSEMIDLVRSDKMIKAGDLNYIATVVDARVLPHLNFQRMTAQAVGPGWRQATPEQKNRMQEEFKTLLVRTYSAAVDAYRGQTMEVMPVQMAAGAKEAVVRNRYIRPGTQPVVVAYSMHLIDSGWKIYDISVEGISLVLNYRSEFEQIGREAGMEGLIARLEKQQARPR